VLDQNVVRPDADAGILQRDAGVRRGLAGDGQKAMINRGVGRCDIDLQIGSQCDDARDFEHDDTRPSQCLDSVTQRAGRADAGVIQSGHFIDVSGVCVAAGYGISAVTDGAGEDWQRQGGGSDCKGREPESKDCLHVVSSLIDAAQRIRAV